MKITLEKVRTYMIQCEAVKLQKALGFPVDLKLSELAELCSKRINYESGQEEATLKGKEQELIWWGREIDDFEFEPIAVIATNDLDKAFKNATESVVIGRFQYTLNPYAAFHNLIKEGVIKIL